MKKIIEFLDQEYICYDQRVELSKFSWFKTGGIANLVIKPDSLDKVIKCQRFFYQNNVSYKTVGHTSNILFLDESKLNVLLSSGRLKNVEIHQDKEEVFVEAGKSLPEFVRVLRDLEIEGYEGLEGIPGTVGGAIFMNASAYDYNITDHLISVKYINERGELVEVSKNDLDLSYRNSLFKKNEKYFIYGGTFATKKGDLDRISSLIDLYHLKRHTYQDFVYPTLGSLFATLDLYRDIARHHPYYRMWLWVFRKIFHSRFTNRRPINKKLLNAFTEWYFKWDFPIQPYSDKTLNCITNKGLETKEIVNYAKLVQKAANNSLRLENEFVIDEETKLEI